MSEEGPTGAELEKTDIHAQSHLDAVERINRGSFYTPKKYVSLVRDWLIRYGLLSGNAVLDSSCGYGAFFELQESLPGNRYVGNDADAVAVETVKRVFPKVETFNENALFKTSRSRFKIRDGETLVVVGNPPYNDVTSQIRRRIKRGDLQIDADLRSRDFGISFLKSYDKLKADYAVILHPLSYLIKKANFKAAKSFFENYSLQEHIVFDSREFAGTSTVNGFPVIVALYKRTPGNGLQFADVWNAKFRTVEGAVFSLSDWDYVSDFVEKYPGKNRYNPEILFYTLRDINALKRSRTFLKERTANAVDVDPQKLPYYCYVDCFKRFAEVPYWMGNFDVPFDKRTFGSVTESAVAVAGFYHPEIIGTQSKDVGCFEKKIKDYIGKVLTLKN